MPITLSTISGDRYLALVQSFPLRPIRTRRVHQQAKAMLRSLVGHRGLAERDYKIVLVSLIADYERAARLQLDTSTVTAAEVVLHLLEERGMSVNALSKTVGVSQSSLSEMLSGRRDWSKQAIIRLSDFFDVEPRLFLA